MQPLPGMRGGSSSNNARHALGGRRAASASRPPDLYMCAQMIACSPARCIVWLDGGSNVRLRDRSLGRSLGPPDRWEAILRCVVAHPSTGTGEGQVKVVPNIWRGNGCPCSGRKEGPRDWRPGSVKALLDVRPLGGESGCPAGGRKFRRRQKQYRTHPARSGVGKRIGLEVSRGLKCLVGHFYGCWLDLAAVWSFDGSSCVPEEREMIVAPRGWCLPRGKSSWHRSSAP